VKDPIWDHYRGRRRKRKRRSPADPTEELAKRGVGDSGGGGSGPKVTARKDLFYKKKGSPNPGLGILSRSREEGDPERLPKPASLRRKSRRGGKFETSGGCNAAGGGASKARIAWGEGRKKTRAEKIGPDDRPPKTHGICSLADRKSY